MKYKVLTKKSTWVKVKSCLFKSTLVQVFLKVFKQNKQTIPIDIWQTTGRLTSHHFHIALGLLTPHFPKKSWISNCCKFFVIILLYSKQFDQKQQLHQDFEIWKSFHPEFTSNYFIAYLHKYLFTVIVKLCFKLKTPDMSCQSIVYFIYRVGQMLYTIAISGYSVITFFGLFNKNYSGFIEYILFHDM